MSIPKSASTARNEVRQVAPHLIELTADQLWLVAGGRVQPYDGDLDDYRRQLLNRGSDSPTTNTAASGNARQAERRRGATCARAERRRGATEAKYRRAAARVAARLSGTA